METSNQNENKLIETVYGNNFLGQTGFISGKERQTSARSKNMSLIVFLTQEDFENVHISPMFLGS